MSDLDKKLIEDIPGYEGLYGATPEGDIWSHRNQKFLKQWTTDNGYKQIVIAKKGLRPHRLVALTFIPNPNDKPFVNHLNGIKTDNRAENLAWCTQAENISHAYSNGLIKPARGMKNGNAVFTDDQVREMRRLHNEGVSYSRLSRIFNYSIGGCHTIVKGLTWTHLTETS